MLLPRMKKTETFAILLVKSEHTVRGGLPHYLILARYPWIPNDEAKTNTLRMQEISGRSLFMIFSSQRLLCPQQRCPSLFQVSFFLPATI